MGIHGSATCTLNFGENGRCRGLLLGGAEDQGIRQMFQMMNEARLQVGAQGVGLAGVAYYNALQYARERVQGAHYTQMRDPEAPRVTILEHPDVRRMLLLMKSSFEGGRALTLFTALQLDLAKLAPDEETKRLHKGLAELLTPVVKAYNTEMGFQMASVGVQILGGYGYCMEYPQEQFLRDAKIGTIYEGTNHIQAMDLVGRKLAMAGGDLFRSFIGLVSKGAEGAVRVEGLGDIAAQVLDARDAVVEVTEHFMKAMGEGRMALLPLSANRFCDMVGRLASGWLLLEHAAIARGRLGEIGADDPDRAFYEGKVASARFFAANVLPELRASAEIVRIGDMTAVEIPDGGF
ncbi:MAG: acyl-CoA dehydrogenase, partial [Myxococcales bacterium]|nr:acyl-CoA dehydrogenase [Myxococcales bacterium]